jgi:hypothetical protein
VISGERSVAVSVSLFFLAIDSRRRVYLEESAQARDVAAWLDTVEEKSEGTLLRTMTIENASKLPISSATGYVLELLSDELVATFETTPKVSPHEWVFHYHVTHGNQKGLYLILAFHDEAGVLWRKYDYLSASLWKRSLWKRKPWKRRNSDRELSDRDSGNGNSGKEGVA